MTLGSFLTLDKQTLLFAFAVLSFFVAGLSGVMARVMPGRGLREWALSILCCALAFSLYLLRSQGPLLLSFLLGNVFVLAAGVLSVLAYARLLRGNFPAALVAACTGIGLAGLLAVHFLGVPVRAALVTLALTLAGEMAAILCLLLRYRRDLHRALSWLAIGAATGMFLAFAGRALIFVFAAPAPGVPYAEPLAAPFGVVLVATLLFVLSTIAFIGLAAEQQRGEAVRELSRDGLTGFLTRSAFQLMVPTIERQSASPGYAVVLVDLDHFKRVNDEHGHDGGDLVLAHAARLIANTMRLTDLAVRYGGEEFCIILRGCAEGEAQQFARRLLKLASQQRVRLGDGAVATFTMSAGVAVHTPVHGAMPESLAAVITRADRALYQAKRAGRNRSLLASVAEPPAAQAATISE